MKSPLAPSSFPMRAGRLVTFGFLMAALPGLGGCPGNLDGGINSIPEGSGGDSGSGSGGTNAGTGGTNAGTGGAVATGSGGTTVSTGGTMGSGGTVSTGGTTVAGTGGMAAGTGGKVGSGGAAGGSAGGSMGSGTGGSGTVATCDAPTMVFKDATSGCVSSGCHAKGSGNTAPDLQTADPTVLKAYKTTILCAGNALVVPSNPTSSVLWKVVDGRTCGDLMPLGKTPLTQAQEDCLAAWIANIK